MRNVFSCPISLVILSSLKLFCVLYCCALSEHVNFPFGPFPSHAYVKSIYFHSYSPSSPPPLLSYIQKILVQIFIVRRCFAYTRTEKILAFFHSYVCSCACTFSPVSVSESFENNEKYRAFQQQPSLSKRYARREKMNLFTYDAAYPFYECLMLPLTHSKLSSHLTTQSESSSSKGNENFQLFLPPSTQQNLVL